MLYRLSCFNQRTSIRKAGIRRQTQTSAQKPPVPKPYRPFVGCSFRRSPTPREGRVREAKAKIQSVLEDLPSGGSIMKSNLYQQLSDMHGLRFASVQWALIDLVGAGLVAVKPPFGMTLNDSYHPDHSLKPVGDARDWPPEKLRLKFTRNGTPDTTDSPEGGGAGHHDDGLFDRVI